MRRMVIASLGEVPELRFVEAGTGLEAIEQLALAPADLMVLDLNMPDMHGIDVLGFLSQYAHYRNMPVIVLTTRGDEDSRRAALAAGVARYMTKPFRPSELAIHVRELLSVVQR